MEGVMVVISLGLYAAIFLGIGIFAKFLARRYHRRIVLQEIEEARLAHLKYYLK
jgi:hypothetical protein